MLRTALIAATLLIRSTTFTQTKPVGDRVEVKRAPAGSLDEGVMS